MIASMIALAVMAQATQDPREHPVAAVEWIDHYGYCLDSVFANARNAMPEAGINRAAQSAAVGCWPVRSSATGAIIQHLARDNPGRSANDRAGIANRALNAAADSFAARIGVARSDLGPLCADTDRHGPCQ